MTAIERLKEDIRQAAEQGDAARASERVELLIEAVRQASAVHYSTLIVAALAEGERAATGKRESNG